MLLQSFEGKKVLEAVAALPSISHHPPHRSLSGAPVSLKGPGEGKVSCRSWAALCPSSRLLRKAAACPAYTQIHLDLPFLLGL